MDNQLLKELRRRAHALKPVVRIGQNGLTEAVVAELDGALAHHELVKIKLSGATAEDRREQLALVCTQTAAETVQQIGHTATIWREAPPKRGAPAKKRPSSGGKARARSPGSAMRPGTRRDTRR